MRRNDDRQAAVALSRPRRSPSPSRARRVGHRRRRGRGRARPRGPATASTGWSADSNPSTSSAARSPTPVEQRLGRVEQPAVGGVQPGLRDRAGRVDARRRSRRSAPTRRAANVGRSCRRIHASVMTPSVPSEPRNSRSGDGPAPEPGSRRDSLDPGRGDDPQRLHQVVDVGVAGWRSARRRGWPASRRASRTRTTAGSAAASSRAAGAGPPARGPNTPAWMRAARDSCGRPPAPGRAAPRSMADAPA